MHFLKDCNVIYLFGFRLRYDWLRDIPDLLTFTCFHSPTISPWRTIETHDWCVTFWKVRLCPLPFSVLPWFTEVAPLTVLGSTCILLLSSDSHPYSMLSALCVMDNQT